MQSSDRLGLSMFVCMLTLHADVVMLPATIGAVMLESADGSSRAEWSSCLAVTTDADIDLRVVMTIALKGAMKLVLVMCSLKEVVGVTLKAEQRPWPSVSKSTV